MKPSSPAKITKSEINQARKPSSWDVANDWLYALCKKHPSHKTNSEIIAKVMLIGRATSAAIERRKIDRDVPDFYLSRVAPKIKRSCIDLWFREIKSASQGLDDGSLKVLVDVHFKLVNLFHDITDLSKRCLASKYLHYHFPSTTFIFDSQASRAAKVLVPHDSDVTELAAKDYDLEYKLFVERCRWLIDEVHKVHRVRLKPRQLDNLLLQVAAK